MIGNFVSMVFAAIGIVTYELPAPPGYGFAVAKDQTILMGQVDSTTRKLQVYRYRPDQGKTVKQVQVYEPKYDGAVEILAVSDGFVIIDYEGSGVAKYAYNGKEIWKVRARYPNVAKLDYAGNIWFFFNSGIVAALTSDSSEPEPILKESGEEIAVHGAADLGPTTGKKFWLATESGDLIYFDERGKRKLVGNFEGVQRLFGLPDGNVLLFYGKEFKTCTPSGLMKPAFTLPTEFSTNISFMGRTYDGRMLLGISRRGGGTAVILDYRLGAP